MSPEVEAPLPPEPPKPPAKPAEPPKKETAKPPAAKPAEQPKKKPAPKPAEPPKKEPAVKPDPKPAAKPPVPPAEKPKVKPAEKKPVEKPAEKPKESPKKQPAAKPEPKPAPKLPAPPAEKSKAVPPKPKDDLDDLFGESPKKEAVKPAPAKKEPAEKKPAGNKDDLDDLDDLFGESPKKEPAKQPAKGVAPEAPAKLKANDSSAAPKQDAGLAQSGSAEDAPEMPADAETAALQPPPFQLAVRTWKNNTGTFQVRARLIEILDGKVRLLKETGRRTTVPMQRLSRFDRGYVQRQDVKFGKGPIDKVAGR